MRVRLAIVAAAAIGLAIALVPRLDTTPQQPAKKRVSPALAETRARAHLDGGHTTLCAPCDGGCQCEHDRFSWSHPYPDGWLFTTKDPSGTVACWNKQERISFDMTWSPDGCARGPERPFHDVEIEVVDAAGAPIQATVLTVGLDNHPYDPPQGLVVGMPTGTTERVAAIIWEGDQIATSSAWVSARGHDHVRLQLRDDGPPPIIVEPLDWNPTARYYRREARTKWVAATRDPDLSLDHRAWLALEAGEAIVTSWLVE